MGIINFIFSSIWIFLGTVILLVILFAILQATYDFIVELIHGKAPTQNFYNVEEPKKNLSLEDDRSKDGEEKGRE